MNTYESIALSVPEILLPKEGTDLSKWAVIACDQFTSDPDYWQRVKNIAGDAPSSLNLIYPEVYLNEKDPEKRIARIRDFMQQYLDQGLFRTSQGFMYVERQAGHRLRKGLLVCLDMEQYDFRKGATTLIRATEGTILERIPPRVRIRQGAPLEIPHIMVLIDNPGNTVIGPLTQNKQKLTKQYDFELMLESGHLTGYRVDDSELEKGIISSLRALADHAAFCEKYGLSPETPVLLYAMGDGNHSFATAKTIWEKTKETAPDKKAILNSTLRYAMVELVNLHDEALVFEPIHRVLFKLAEGRNVVDEITAFYPQRCFYTGVSTAEEMMAEVNAQQESAHRIGMITEKRFGVIEVTNPDSHLPAATLQNFLDVFMGDGGAEDIDYVHGVESVVRLGKKPGSTGFFLPAMDKHDLFKTVILDGALPRKTFSMGEAWEKRFYMEARKLSE